MRLLVLPLAGLALAAPAFADTLVAKHGGLACRSLRALAVLTLPDGSSRVGSPQERPGDADLKSGGGCVDIHAGAKAIIQKSWRRTALVAFDPGDGSGPQYLTVPLINFANVSTSPGSAAPAGGQGQWRSEGDTYIWVPPP